MNGPGKTTDKTVGGYETETGLYEKLNKVQISMTKTWHPL